MNLKSIVDIERLHINELDTEMLDNALIYLANSKIGHRRKLLKIEKLMYVFRWRPIKGLISFLLNPDLKFGDEFITEDKTYKYVTSYDNVFIILDVETNRLTNIRHIKTKEKANDD